MSEPYQEIVAGERVLRLPPSPRHELICARLYERVLPVLADLPQFRPLPPREMVELSTGTVLRPDLTLIGVESGKPWLIAEVLDSADHHTDTVMKKEVFEDLRLPRLWMVDPRYNSFEVYRGSNFGLSLRDNLAAGQVLEEELLPGLRICLKELFAEEGR